MSLNIKDAPKGTMNKNNPIPSKGDQLGVLIQVIGLGLQEGGEWQGEKKPDKVKVRFTYELPEETAEFDGEEKPLIVSEEFPLSSHEKSTCVARLDALDPNNETDGDLEKLLGRTCLVSIGHREGKGKHQGRTFANITGVAGKNKYMPEVKREDIFNPLVTFDPSNPDIEVFEALPEFLQNKINSRLDGGPITGAPAQSKKPEPEAEEESWSESDADTSGEW